jgi:TolB-like protein/predicted Ser/Thr protein kinase
MGSVYRSYDHRHERTIAIKILKQDMPDHLARSRFLREAELTALIDHPNVVHIYDVGHLDDTDYIAMELVEGQSLQDEIPAQGLDVAHTFHLAIQIAEGMEAAHAAGVVHRDLKPGNILVTPDRKVKIVDFGVAKRNSLSHLPDTKLTHAGSFIGTLAYAAPEQAFDGEVDNRADIYSFGVVLHQMLTGDLPFAAPNPVAMLVALQSESPRMIRTTHPQVPASLQSLVLRALAKRPGARIQSMTEFAKRLRDLEAHPPEADEMATIERPAGALLATLRAAGVELPPSIGSERTSIAVIPLRCLSSEADDPFLAAGISEEVTRALTGAPGLRVAPALAASRFGDGTYDPQDLSITLNTRYIFSGSLRRSGNKIRVTAQLTDGIQQSLLWSKNYDSQLEDIFDLQDQISQAIVRSLSGQLIRADVESAYHSPTDSLDAWGLARKAYYIWHSAFSVAGVHESVALLRRAVQLDPNYALAHAHLGLYLIQSVIHRISGDLEGDKKEALESAERALSFAPNQPGVLAESSLVLLHCGKYEEGTRHLKRAVEVAPFDLTAWGYLGFGHACAGNRDELEQGYRILNHLLKDASDHPSVPYWLHFATLAALRLGRFEEAESLGRRATEKQPGFVFNQVVLAEALCRLDRIEEAKQVVAAIPMYNPYFTLAQFEDTADAICRDPKYTSQLCGRVRELQLL